MFVPEAQDMLGGGSVPMMGYFLLGMVSIFLTDSYF